MCSECIVYSVYIYLHLKLMCSACIVHKVYNVYIYLHLKLMCSVGIIIHIIHFISNACMQAIIPFTLY